MKEKTLRILLIEDNAGDVRLAREMFMQTETDNYYDATLQLMDQG
jgi:hypothetical protein